MLSVVLSWSYQRNPNELYDANQSSLINLNPKNFDTQITNNRAKNVISFVHFYTLDDGRSTQYKKVIEELGKEYEGMFKLSGINCKIYSELCSKQDVKDFPSFLIYPPLPAPVMKYEGEIDPKHIIGYLGKFVVNRALDLNNNNFEGFLNKHANLPKIILFTDKKGTPLLFKRLSAHFDKKIEFGVVHSDMTGITSKYKITKFPKIMAVGVDKKRNFYEGEIKYKLIFDFCNVYQETFFVVGSDNTGVDPPQKLWMNDKFPELTKDSGNDWCFKVDSAICVLLLNKEKPNDHIEGLFDSIQNWLSPKINRGLKYKYGWINTSKQSSILQVMNVEKNAGPLLVLINSGSRKRYYVDREELTEENMQKVFDKLASGDLRFGRFKDNKIPDLEL